MSELIERGIAIDSIDSIYYPFRKAWLQQLSSNVRLSSFVWHAREERLEGRDELRQCLAHPLSVNRRRSFVQR
jgi:hypothetical protein